MEEVDREGGRKGREREREGRIVRLLDLIVYSCNSSTQKVEALVLAM